MTEAFVYLWYDALNKMYYLGKHKGSPDDTYTHSSSIWESFTKDNIPEGVTREILADGTDEEMCILEHELLVKAKNGGDWDRYYNQSLGDPRYVDQWGENNPAYKDGRAVGIKNIPGNAAKIAYDKKRNQTPERKEYARKRNQTSEFKAYRKEWAQTPKGRESQKRRTEKYNAKKKAETGYTHGYSRAKNNTERQGEGTLEAFMK